MKNIDEKFCFQQKYLEEFPIGEYLNAARAKIKDAQQSPKTGECFLSFYPLAKNIRFISSYFYKAVQEGRRPILSGAARPGEEAWWKETTNTSWHPWLWTRYFNNDQSWNNIFLPVERDIETLGGDGAYSSFYLYLACLHHVFAPINFSSIQFTGKVCGLQIRRGEIVPLSGEIKDAWPKRKIYSIDEYMSGVALVCEALKTNQVFVSTDSSETINYLRESYPSYQFLCNSYNRDAFIRYGGRPESVHLEVTLSSEPTKIQHYTESCIADLHSLSMCQGYVGGMTFSEYGLCGWFLQMAQQKKITSYYNVEGELNFADGILKMLLL